MTHATLSRDVHLETVIEFELDPADAQPRDLRARSVLARRLAGVAGVAVGAVVVALVATGTTAGPSLPAPSPAPAAHTAPTTTGPDSPSAEAATRAAHDAEVARATVWVQTHGPGSGAYRTWSSDDPTWWVSAWDRRELPLTSVGRGLSPPSPPEETRTSGPEVALHGDGPWRCAVRRRRLIFRSVVLVVALGGALALLLPTPWFSLGLAVLGIVLALTAVFALVNLLAVRRDRAPDHEPPGAWWWCELPIDHRFVRVAAVDSTWRCTRCGDVRHVPPPRATSDVWAQGDSGFPMGYHD